VLPILCKNRPTHLCVEVFIVEICQCQDIFIIALPKELRLKTDSKPLHVIFLIPYQIDLSYFVTFCSEHNFESQFRRRLIFANVLFVNDMFKLFCIVYLVLNFTAI